MYYSPRHCYCRRSLRTLVLRKMPAQHSSRSCSVGQSCYSTRLFRLVHRRTGRLGADRRHGLRPLRRPSTRHPSRTAWCGLSRRLRLPRPDGHRRTTASHRRIGHSPGRRHLGQPDARSHRTRFTDRSSARFSPRRARGIADHLDHPCIEPPASIGDQSLRHLFP